MNGFNLDKVDPLALSRSFPVVDDGKGNFTLQGEPVYLIDGPPEQGYRVRKGSKACGFFMDQPVFRPWDFCSPDESWLDDCDATEADIY